MEWFEETDHRQSEELRRALRAAERILRLALSLTNPNRQGDRTAATKLRDALGVVTDHRMLLERGGWPERRVAAHPIGLDRWHTAGPDGRSDSFETPGDVAPSPIERRSSTTEPDRHPSVRARAVQGEPGERSSCSGQLEDEVSSSGARTGDGAP